MAAIPGDPRTRRGSLRLPRRVVAAAVVVLLAVLLVAQNSTVVVPEMTSYRLIDQRTIVLTVGVAPCAWTRVTGVTETAAEIDIKVETLPCPLPGPGTAQLDLRELTVAVTADVADRVVADDRGQPVPFRPSGHG